MGILCAHSFSPSCVYLFCGFCSPFMCLSFETPISLWTRECTEWWCAVATWGFFAFVSFRPVMCMICSRIICIFFKNPSRGEQILFPLSCSLSFAFSLSQPLLAFLFLLYLVLSFSLSRFIALSLHGFPFQYLTSPIPSFSPSHPSCPSFRHSIPAFLIFLILENSACAWVILCMQMCAVHKDSETRKTRNSKTDRERERMKERERDWKREREFLWVYREKEAADREKERWRLFPVDT